MILVSSTTCPIGPSRPACQPPTACILPLTWHKARPARPVVTAACHSSSHRPTPARVGVRSQPTAPPSSTTAARRCPKPAHCAAELYDSAHHAMDFDDCLVVNSIEPEHAVDLFGHA